MKTEQRHYCSVYFLLPKANQAGSWKLTSQC